MAKRLQYICFFGSILAMALTLLSFSSRPIVKVATPLPRAILEPIQYADQVEEDDHALLGAHAKVSEDAVFEEIKKELPNIPSAYLETNSKLPMGFNRTCARFPELLDLEFDNLYWQIARTSNGTFRLMGAYLDNRSTEGGAAVRLLGMMDRLDPVVVTHCQLWFKDAKEPVIVKSSQYYYIWYAAWGNAIQGMIKNH